MTKKVIISGYYGFGNFGDELILSVLVQHLKELGVENVVLSSNPTKTSKEHFVNAVNSFDFNQVSEQIKHSDILISGGGSLLQDATSLKSLIYYLWVIFTALINKKDIIIFAQGIGPIKNKFAQIITKLILKKCKYISVRDENSQKLLKNWGITSDLLCDPIFSMKLNPSYLKGVVGIQLRNFSTMNDNLLKKLAQQIIKEFSDKKIKILSFQKSIDKEICLKFQDILKSMAPEIKAEIVDDNIIYNIFDLEYLIGMRFHALIMALKAGIKCIGINYDIKVEKLAKSADIPLISMDAKENFDEIFNAMKNLNSDKLIAFANSQIFDWSEIDKILK